jgi:hypothetical protein
MVEDSFESLHEDQLCAWLRAKNKGLKAMTYPQFPSAGLTGSVRFRWPPRQGARMPRTLEQWPWHGAEPTILPARAHPLMVLTHQVALASATMRVQHSMV